MPALHEFLVSLMGLTPENAREALRAEGYQNFPVLSADTPARSVGHPFDKNLIAQPHALYQKWARQTARQPLTTSCPDFALTAPQPIVFEAKYFAGGSRYQAEKDLAADAYQAFSTSHCRRSVPRRDAPGTMPIPACWRLMRVPMGL